MERLVGGYKRLVILFSKNKISHPQIRHCVALWIYKGV